MTVGRLQDRGCDGDLSATRMMKGGLVNSWISSPLIF